MSEPLSTSITGADLDQLDELASAAAAAGAAIATRAGELRTRIIRTVSAFEATIDRLRADTDRTAATMEDEIGDLGVTAAAVAWTGANRAAFDDDLQRFAGVVRAGTATLVEGVAEIRIHAVERFSGLLDESGRAISEAGDGAEVAAGDVHRGVATQREQLHAAADVGWTTA